MLAAPGSYSREIFLAFCIALMAEEAPCPPQYAGHKSLYEVLARAGLPVTSGRDVSCVNFGAKLSLGGRMDANHDAAWDFVLHGPSMRVAAFEPNPHDCHSCNEPSIKAPLPVTTSPSSATLCVARPSPSDLLHTAYRATHWIFSRWTLTLPT